MKFLKDLSVKGKKILYRVDINSPLQAGRITDDSRIRAILPTIKYLLKEGAHQITLLAHQGRDKKPIPENRLDQHGILLEKLLHEKIVKLDNPRPDKIPEKEKLIMLENVRLDDEDSSDKGKRDEYARALSKLGDIYVNDAFAASHRDHATIASLPKLMKEKSAGLLLEKEIKALEPLVQGKIQAPFTIIMGGAKIDTKIGVLKYFSQNVDNVLVGGGIANTFLFAEGYDIGQSLCEEDKMDEAQEIALSLDTEENHLHLPTDVLCADDLSPDAMVMGVPVEDVMGDMRILDLGKKTVDHFIDIIQKSKTILWNGPMGYAEYLIFRGGSAAIAHALADLKGATTIIGGGETVALLNALEIPHEKFTHVSTGGGAMMEYLSGRHLPGMKALEG